MKASLDMVVRVTYLCCVMKACEACNTFSSAPLNRNTASWRSGAGDAASARSVSSSTAQPAPSSLAPAHGGHAV